MPCVQHADVHVVENTAHTSNITERIPPKHELERLLDLMLEEINLPPEKEANIRNRTPQEQWQLIQPHMRRRQTTDTFAIIGQLQSQLDEIYETLTEETEESLTRRCELLEALSVALRTHPVHYIEKFVELDGLTLLLDILSLLDPSGRCFISLWILSK